MFLFDILISYAFAYPMSVFVITYPTNWTKLWVIQIAGMVFCVPFISKDFIPGAMAMSMFKFSDIVESKMNMGRSKLDEIEKASWYLFLYPVFITASNAYEQYWLRMMFFTFFSLVSINKSQGLLAYKK